MNVSKIIPLNSPGYDDIFAIYLTKCILGLICFLFCLVLAFLFLRFPKLRSSSTSILIHCTTITGILIGAGLTIRGLCGLFLYRRTSPYFPENSFQCSNILQSFGIAFNHIITIGLVLEQYRNTFPSSDKPDISSKVS